MVSLPCVGCASGGTTCPSGSAAGRFLRARASATGTKDEGDGDPFAAEQRETEEPMNRMWMAGAIALSLSSVTAAQNSQPTSNPQSAPRQDARSTVTVTGCVQQANGRFFLANARVASTAPATAANTQAPAASQHSESDRHLSTFLLTANTTDLHNHVGHDVDIVGRVAPGSRSISPATRGTPSGSGGVGTSTGDASNGTGTRGSSANRTDDAQVLEVQSVRMIASTCSAR